MTVATIARQPVRPRALEQEPARATHRPRRARELAPIYVAIAPFYVVFAVFGLFPVVFSLWLAFHRWDGIGPMRWVGLDQFRFLLTDSSFYHSLWVTFVIWVLSTVPMLVLALIVAFALNSSIRRVGLYRIAFFIPNITSTVAIAIVFGSVFSNNFGLLNAVFQGLGLDSFPWLTSQWGIRIAVATMLVWRWTGYNAIIFLAGLQAIPTDVLEAARVDGAGPFQTAVRVLLPMLRPIILFTVITSTIGGLQVFAEPQVLVGTTGGPGAAGMTTVLYLYQQAFSQQQFGYGAAIGWGLFVVLILFSILNWRIVQRIGNR